MNKKSFASTLAISATILAGALVAPAPAPAPAQAIDSQWSLCAGLYSESSKTDCFADIIEDTYLSEAELMCYRKAAVAVAASVSGTLITTRDARIIAGAAGVAGVWACINTFV